MTEHMTEHMTEENSTYDQTDPIGSTVAHPWIRYFARSLDFFIYRTIWMALAHLCLRYNVGSNSIENLINIFFATGIMFMIEPILITVFGTTIGKWIFGLKINKVDGSKLSYSESLKRTFGIFSLGWGYHIPVFNIFRLYKCYEMCKAGEPLPWELDENYTLKDYQVYRVVIAGIVAALLFALNMLVLLQAQMPIHRGELSAAAYYENYNDYISYWKFDFGKKLNTSGEWVDENADGFVVMWSAQELPKPELVIENGIVKEVKIEVVVKEETDAFLQGYTEHFYLATMSLMGAQKEMNGLRFYQSGVLKRIGNGFENFTFDEAGVRVSNTVEYSGYDYVGNQMLLPIEGENQNFHMVFTVKLIED